MMSDRRDTGFYQQFQKTCKIVDQHLLEWKKLISSSGKTLELLLNLCDIYHCALSYSISDTPLNVYPDLNQLTEMKKVSALSDKLDELLAVMYVHLRLVFCIYWLK
jgi:hypothetical protein